MRLDDLPADLLLLVLGRLNAADLARAAEASGTLRATVQPAAANALRRLDEAAGTEVQRGDGLSYLQQLRACEAFFIINFSTFVHREFRGDLPPPEPSPSGCKFFEQLGRLERASRDVTTGGELALQSPLGSECRLEYRFLLVNDGVPCKHVPSQGACSFLFLRKVMEVFETYVPPHLRGWRVGDRLAQQAFQMVHDSAVGGRPRFRLRPTCTFVSGSFLRRHPTLPTDCPELRETASRLEFFSTPVGQAVTARRVALKALPVAELKAMCQQHGFPTAFRKPALIEFLIYSQFDDPAFSPAGGEAAPVQPKNIDISLSARWPASPAAVEAAEFVSEEDSSLFWRFAEGLAKEDAATAKVRRGEGTDREQFDHVIDVASGLLSPLGLRMLKAFFAAHVLSPPAEMWRQVAEDEARQYEVPAGATAWLRSCGRALPIDAQPAAAIASLIEAVTGSADCAVPAKAEDRAVSDMAPLSRDHVHGSPAEGAPMVVLYAPLGSAAFAAAHAVLEQQSAQGTITYVYRPLWVASAKDARQTLQGYGVQLAIKNMEYKTMDDAAIKDLGGMDDLDGGAALDGPAEDDDEHGFYFGTLRARRPELNDTITTFKDMLAASLSSQDASSLKVWALQDLGVLASSRVLNSKEPLRALVEISQNFPFIAPSLTKSKVDRALEDEVEQLQHSAWGPGFSGAFINGRELPIGENDLAGLLQTIRRELHTVDALSFLQLPIATTRKLLQLPAPSTSLRIDAKHPAVFVLNDVAKDKRYAQWPSTVRELLRPNMWGQISFCRKNVFTMVFVVDPSTEDGLAALGFMSSLFQQGAPIRFGVVLAPGASKVGAAKGGARRGSPFEAGSASRLKALRSTYDAAWDADAQVKKLAAAADAAPPRADAAADAAGGAVVVDEEDEESKASAALGLLLTKLFIFCKRKAGNQAAMNFLSLTNQVREVGGFFGSHTEPLTEAHLDQAFSHAVQRKKIDGAPIFEGLRSGTLTDYDAEAAAGLAFLQEKGLEAPALLTNGVHTPLAGQSIEQEVMNALNSEVRSVQHLVRTRKITDETADVYSAIANHSATFPRYNKDLLLSQEKIALVPLEPAPALKEHMRWLYSPREEGGAAEAGEPPLEPPAPAAGMQDEMGDEGFDEEEPGGLGEGGAAAPAKPITGLRAVTHLVSVDLLDEEGLVLLAHSLQALEASPAGRLRLGVLLNPAKPSAAADAAAAAWLALAAEPEPVPRLRRLLALLLLAVRAAGPSGTPDAAAVLASPLLGHLGGRAAAAPPGALAAHRATCAQLRLQPGAAAVISNGRLVQASGPAGLSLDEVDLALLEEFEFKQRAEAAGVHIAEASPPAAEDGSTLGEAQAEDWRSDALMFAATQLSAMRLANHEASDGRRKMQLGENLECGRNCIVLPGHGAGEAMELVAVLDPLSKEAQRFGPIALQLQQALGLTITLHLNPELKMSEFPLENFYRYVVALEPRFTEAGAALAPQDDHALFAALRTPQVLTLHLDAPDKWLYECVEAAYDMDNVRLSQMPDTQRTLTARYELTAILITGACEDVSSNDPPSGLQLLLGTATRPHITDTLVMSNLGYFQLKAAPGVWEIALAPGPSSDVYQIKGEPSLLATGHSATSARKSGIELARLVPLTKLRVAVHSFSGEHTLLLATKRPGMERVSILDDGQKHKEGGGGGGELAADAGVLGSLKSWAGFGGAGGADDETVHVFSLASGHLYERFLKIMMVSVLQRTDRKVKFWLLKNFLSPAFIAELPSLAAAAGFEYGLVQYQWPSWLHKQTDKQRIIWGYKILFLDVMFPLSVRKIIYIDADQVVNADVGELWDMPLKGRAAVGMTPFCNKDANGDTTGFRFFAQGYWKDHLNGRPYHISALFVVDLHKFRRRGYGDQYRIFYDNLSKDPNSLANLDQDLPNYAQHVVPIHSLPESWLWCETWCGNQTKPEAKTIDLCNNPLTKEPKLNQATRVIGQRWTELDEHARKLSVGEARGVAKTVASSADSTPGTF